MRQTILLLVAFAALFGLPATILHAQTQTGAIKAVKIEHAVLRLAADGTETPVAEGQLLTEHDVITTGRDASVVLVFANGSSVRLGALSRVAIDEFKMDPLAETIAVASLQQEPTTSKTHLTLAYGELVGQVRKLHTDRGSSFTIKTAVGAAGIRGTTFRLVLHPDATGRSFNFQLSTAEGVVVFNGTVPAATSQTGGTEVAVTANQEVNVTAEVDPATNTVTNLDITAPQTISSEALQQITTAVTAAIQQAQTSTTFTPAEQSEAAQTSATAPQTTTSQTTGQTETETTTTKTEIDTSARSPSGS